MGVALVIRQTWVQDRTAAVPLLARILLGGAGLVAAAVVALAAPGADKLLAVAFLIFPVLPALWGIGIDYRNARDTLNDQAGPPHEWPNHPHLHG